MNFDKIYSEYFTSIYKFIFRTIGDGEQANDITQETFIKFYHYLTANNEIRNPKAWLYRVAVNMCKNYMRRRSTYHQVINTVAEPNNPSEDVELTLIKEEKKKLVRAALAKLSKRDQILLQLYNDGFSYSEMAEIMHLKKASIGKFLSRAIEKCTRYIEE